MYLHASFIFAWFDFVHWDKEISVVPNLQWLRSSKTREKKSDVVTHLNLWKMTKNIAILPGPILKRTSYPIHICFWRCKYPEKRPNIHWSYPWIDLPNGFSLQESLRLRLGTWGIAQVRPCRWDEGKAFISSPFSRSTYHYSFIKIQPKNLWTLLGRARNVSHGLTWHKTSVFQASSSQFERDGFLFFKPVIYRMYITFPMVLKGRICTVHSHFIGQQRPCKQSAPGTELRPLPPHSALGSTR